MKITLVLQNSYKYNEIYDEYQTELFTTYIDVMQSHVDRLKSENIEFQKSLIDLRERVKNREIDTNSPEFLNSRCELSGKLNISISSIPTQKEIMGEVYLRMENMKIIDDYVDSQSDDISNYESDDYDYFNDESDESDDFNYESDEYDDYGFNEHNSPDFDENDSHN